ncbi:MAG: glycosyltransferase family 2 protein [Victivallales bacterium]|nr:glycosyltransferase family 2 protein [Victivallales bacterium]
MLGVVIVIYKSVGQVAAYVSQELVKIQADYRAVVVDVGCDDVDDLRLPRALGMADGVSEAGRLFLLREKENLGYARGNNLGVDFLLRRFPEIDSFLITNDDIQFISSNVIDKLTEKMASLADVAVIGPRIVNLQDEEQLPELTPPPIGWEIRRNVLLPILGRRLRGRTRGKVESGYVYRLEGCFMLVRKEDFLACGKFDERTFLYREEAILAERLKAVGKRMYYDASVTIRHFVGNTTSKKAPNLLLLDCELFGQQLYFSEYAKSSAVMMGLLRLSQWIRVGLVKLAILKRKLRGADR